MTKTFTENDLVRFIYGELSQKEKSALKDALKRDETLKTRLKELEDTTQQLSRVSFEAPSQTVDKILAYSRGLETEDI